MNNAEYLMIGMKAKGAIKLDTIPLDKTYPQEKLYCPKKDCIDTFINLVDNKETKKGSQHTLLGAKIRID